MSTVAVPEGVARVRRWAFWLSPAGQQSIDVPWKEGLTARDVVPEDLREREGLDVRVNGVVVPHLDVRVGPADQVDVSIRPTGPGIAALSPLAKFAFYAIASVLVTGAINVLLGVPRGPKKRKDDESDNFAWSGFANTRVEGQPRMRIYGRLRVAPQIIDEFTRCRNTPGQEDLYRLFSFGEGPLTRVMTLAADTAPDAPRLSGDATNPIPIGCMVGDNQLENLREAVLHLRLGTNEQEPITGFEDLWTDYVPDQEMKEQETNSSGNTTLNSSVDPTLVAYDADNGAPNATESDNAQAVWTQFGARFALATEADAYTIVVTFPQGLYRITNSSGLADAGFQMAVRYREIDAFGNPLLVGGNRGNGWVYVRPDQMMLSHKQEPFSREFAGDFYNPQGFTAATAGKCLDAASTNMYASIAAPTLPASWAAATDLDGFTVEGWFRLWQLPTSTASSDLHRPLFEWSDGTSTNNRGFGLSIEATANTALAALQWGPVGFAGTPNGLRTIKEVPTLAFSQLSYTVDAVPTGWSAWHHAAFTYEKAPSAGITARFRIFFDNQLVIEKTYSSSGNDHVQGCSADPFEFLRGLRFAAGTTKYGLGALDEFRVWDHAKSAVEIDAIWNGGFGKLGSDTAGLVCGFHYDSNANDYGTSANHATLNGGATAGSVTGWVWTEPANVKKRARYEIECLRLNVKSTSNRVADESRVSRIYGRIAAQLAYPGQPLVGLRTRADDTGDVTFIVDGMPVPTWDGLSLTSPAIVYRFDSTNYRPPPGRNPAWIALDIATNSRSSLSDAIGFSRVDLPSFLELAQYSDELIYDGKGARQTIHESTTSHPISDLRYDVDLFGTGQSGIEILYRSSPTIYQPPAHWKVGGFLGFTGLPSTSGIAVDLNTSALDGFQIEEIENVSGAWVVRVRYDAATHGTPWTSGALASVAYTGGTLTGTVEGREARFQFDAAYDSFEWGWDVLMNVLATARSIPIMDGGILRVKIDRPRQPVAMITHANTLVESDDEDSEELVSSFELEYIGSYDKPTKYVVDFQDGEQNYERRSARVPFPGTDPTYVAPSDIVENLTLQGITRRSQVVRDASFRLLVNRYLTRKGRCALGLDGLAVQAGDISTLASDLVSWGKSGRIASASSVTQVVLDRAVTLAAATTYYLRVRLNASGQTELADGQVGDVCETLQVTTAAGTYAAGSTITVASPGYSAQPAKDDLYSLFAAGTEFQSQVTEVTLEPKRLTRQLEWIQYDERVYDVDDLEADVPVF